MVAMIQYYAEFFSLVATVPTVILAASVVHLWFPAARKAWLADQRLAKDWFILGVVSGFAGALLDNLYWSIPWTAAFLDMEQFPRLVELGVYFNIVFRQGLGIFAAYCHVRAAMSSNDNRMKSLNFLLTFSAIAACLFGYALIIAKS